MLPSLAKSADELMVQYAHYHRDRRNIRTHLIGIPLIVLAIFLFLVRPVLTLGGWPLTAAWLLWALGAAWYLSRGHRTLGLATVLATAALCALAHGLNAWLTLRGAGSWPSALGLFVVGWVFQFVGHYWEGKKPAFADDLVGLLVGPMFVVGEFMMAFGALAPLRHTIETQAGPTR